jgi:hypothetical protein
MQLISPPCLQLISPALHPAGSASHQSSKSLEERVAEALQHFQQQLSSLAAAGDNTAMLTACDALRDDTLVELGIRLEDRPDGAPAAWPACVLTVLLWMHLEGSWGAGGLLAWDGVDVLSCHSVAQCS